MGQNTEMEAVDQHKAGVGNDHLEHVTINGEPFFKISDFRFMRPFFMRVVSHSDHWMFISSTGGLTAGRKNADHALFPYYTDDKISESAHLTGSKTIIRLENEQGVFDWEPLSDRFDREYDVERNLYKSRTGNKIRFEEHNRSLGLTFWYEWNSSELYGFVRRAGLINFGQHAGKLELLDGIQNILPSGVGADLQSASSNLVDAYKRNELVEGSGLAIYALSAFIVDKAEPSESLKATIAWSFGLENPVHLLSSGQLPLFRRRLPIREEVDIKGEKGAYMLHTYFSLRPGEKKEWTIIADVDKDHSSIIRLIEEIKNDPHLMDKVAQDIDRGTQKLKALVASSDGLQRTRDIIRDARHFSNTLFNIMRGGIFDLNYRIDKKDFLQYLVAANHSVGESYSGHIEKLGESFTLFDLRTLVDKLNDADLSRLAIEYLPLKFSRRHGDPSRPWNKFSINIRDAETGKKVLDYEGNWRDLFQNWEALACSFPEFIEGMIFKFLNASTFDGYNPYRVTKDGFDWETIEPDNPWSYIGYWGDHQIIYLQKFLEISEKHFPGRLDGYFNREIFVYANVPYRIRSYEEILKNPKDTIDFDHDGDHAIHAAKGVMGSDGALLRDESGTIYRVNFIEKILASVLAKLSNFIPEAGIWMNTQRPEWNDANNALVGNGASMVTLGYLRRMLAFLGDLLDKTELAEVKVSNEVVDFYKRVRTALEEHSPLLSGNIDEMQRKVILDKLGQAASDYRVHVYNHGLWGRKRTISISGLKKFIRLGIQYMDHSLVANRRKDGMYHAYNLVSISEERGVEIAYLSEMLEGQVSVLSSGFLAPDAALSTLDAMKASKLFRPDQYSYILYPNKALPRFLEKNRIPAEKVEGNTLLSALVAQGDGQIIKKDVLGEYHFNGSFHNARDLDKALEKLRDTGFAPLIEEERKAVLEIFEQVFDHKSFTGRSGTFYGYEGLGSIYWHMVSKLQLAVQECCLQAIGQGWDPVTVGRLLEHYYEINEGIGIHKPPTLYGAFPTDPYSHTPAGRGAQQPGMTGQVKEDILSRFGELGVFVAQGQLYFNPCLLRKDEFRQKPSVFHYVDIFQQAHEMTVEPGTLCFTYCQIPVIYRIGVENALTAVRKDGTQLRTESLFLDPDTSRSIFRREGEIVRLIVELDPEQLK